MNNTDKIKLSVIVPVYNREQYLRQCIDSILGQYYDNMEIILVDDGSTDGSGELCDQYQAIDKRIQVIHQKNSGSVLARLHGLQKSKGEYIGFVDSDDWIAADMYQILMSVAEKQKCDIVSMGYMYAYNGETKIVRDGTLLGIYEKEKNMDILLSKMMYDPKEMQRGVHPSLCTKVIKRKCLISVHDHIDSKITLGDDAAVFYPCCLRINRINILEEYKYYYRIHDSSMCRSMNINTIEDVYYFYSYMKRNFIPYENKYNLLTQLKKYIWTFINSGLKQIFNFNIQPVYIFPYTLIEKNTDIILYGAGRVGQSYYCQLVGNHYCHISAWVDKDEKKGNITVTPDKIVDFSYSKIVIAIKSKKIAEEIIEELSGLGISRESMIWEDPQGIPSILLVD